jgi:CHAD domain-containing protein
LDTADWRIHSSGRILEADEEPGGRTVLVLRDGATEAVLISSPTARLPYYGSDLPPGSLWEQVSTVVEGRRLLVQSETETHAQRVAVVNSDQKTTARVLIERHVVGAPELPRHPIVRTATVVPIRGYERTARRAAEVLTGAGARPSEETLLASCLTAEGRPAAGTKLGPGVELRRTMTASAALAAILERLRYHVLANEAGTREQLDVEFLHEYRVAIRRARSLLKRTQGVLAKPACTALAEELSWLAALTGPVRDDDVYLEQLGASGRDDLDPLRAYLEQRRRDAQSALLAAMDSLRYHDLLEAWRTIGDVPARPGDAPLARQAAGDLADQAIAKAYKRVLRLGGAIGPSSPPEHLHDLRKRAKELRYLLECFQTLYPSDERAVVVRELKALQDNLGEYQDCQVQAEALHTMAEALLEARQAPATTLMAMGRLAEEQERREMQARMDFDQRFARFSSKSNRDRFAALVEHGKKDGR